MVIVTDEDTAKSASSPVKPRAQGPSDPPAYSDVGDQPRVFRATAAQGSSSSERDAMLASSHLHHHHLHHHQDLEGHPHHHHKQHYQRKSFFSRHGTDDSGGHGHGLALSPGQAAAARFGKALLIAIVVYMFFGFLVRSIVELANHGRVHLGNGGSISKDWPEFPSGEVKSCAARSTWSQPISNSLLAGESPELEGSGEMVDFNTFGSSSEVSTAGIPWRNSTNMSFSISDASSLDTLYFLSRGSLATGSVRVFTKGDGSNAGAGAGNNGDDTGDDDDTVRVYVRVYYHTQAALERVSVCDLERSGGKQRGVGIFTPRNWHTRNPLDYLRFEVDVVLPPESASSLHTSPKLLKRLETDYSNFALQLGVLRFNSMDLATSNAPIISNAIIAEDIHVKSSNGPIIGSFNVSSSLKLVTSNGKIQVDVNMRSDKASKPTDLVMRTSNGPVEASLELIAADSPADSAFRIQSTTSNNHNDVAVKAQPLGTSLVTVDSKTSNSKASVLLPPPFEGSFTLRTSNAQPNVVADDVEDPSGEGRRRQLTWSRYGNTANGLVNWGAPRSKPKSWVHLESSNSPVTLLLKDV